MAHTLDLAISIFHTSQPSRFSREYTTKSLLLQQSRAELHMYHLASGNDWSMAFHAQKIRCTRASCCVLQHASKQHIAEQGYRQQLQIVRVKMHWQKLH